MGQGTVTPEELAERLASSKQIMNKVETGNFKRTKLNNNENYESGDYFINENVEYTNPKVNINKINNSKLPDEIKKAMIEKPISYPNEISLSDSFDIKMVQKAKKLMNENNLSNNGKRPVDKERIVVNENLSQLLPLMENMIRKVLDEKLNQILMAQDTKSINENLVLKVGDSIFKGKITGVKKK